MVRTRPHVAAGLALAGAVAALAAFADPAPIERSVGAALAEARREAGHAPIERRAALDDAARARAARIAALPHGRRLALGESVEVELDRGGAARPRRAAQHVDMNRGYHEPAAGFVKSWKRAEGPWRTALDPSWDAFGVGVAEAGDGWVVLVSFFVEDTPVPAQYGDLGRRAFDAVNDVRREHGLTSLEYDAGLAAVARGHSEDMVRRGYFDHRSPEGFSSSDRALAAGIRYRRLAENIQRNRGARDPVATAVRSWLDSPGHRRTMLDDGFAVTGVGVAFDDDGSVVFTQLFMLADEAAAPSPP